MKKLILNSFALLMLLTISMVACNKDDTTTTTTCTTTPTYTADVKTIMDKSCATAGCHNATTKADGYDLSTYAGVKSAASKSLSAMKSGSMPKGGSKLSDATIQTFQCWITNSTPQ